MSFKDGAGPGFNPDRVRADVIFKSAGNELDELDYIARLLEDVLYTIRDRPWRAAWRLADAGGRLRRVLESGDPSRCGPSHPNTSLDDTGRQRIAGLQFESGLGCVLPRIPDGR
jgi:hypothetical protein